MGNKEYAAHKLPWSGLFSREQVSAGCEESVRDLDARSSSSPPRPSPQRNRLKAEFPSIIMCPGSTGRFGKSDEGGMLYVMGAAGGYTDAKRILRRWDDKQQDATVQWWVAYMEKKAIEPITVSITPHRAVDELALAGVLTFALAVLPSWPRRMTSSTASATLAGPPMQLPTGERGLWSVYANSTFARERASSRRRSTTTASHESFWNLVKAGKAVGLAAASERW